MKLHSLLMIAAVLLLASASCKKRHNSTTCANVAIPQGSLYGHYVQDTKYPPGIGYFARTTYDITFSGSDFKMTSFSFTDVVNPQDTCGSSYYEYTKGTWSSSGYQLTFTGSYYTDTTYGSLKTGGCHNSGNYSKMFYAYGCNDVIYMMPVYIGTAGTVVSTDTIKLVKQ